MNHTTEYARPAPYKGLAIGSAILASCILAIYVMQQIGIIPMNPF